MWGKKIKLDPADTEFSVHIRLRDKKCLRCGRIGEPDRFGRPIKGLECSHYWSRRHEGTRFEPDDCMTFCAYDHDYLGHGEGRDEYKKMMTDKLGPARMKTLEVQAFTYHKKDRKMEWIKFKELNKTYDENNN